MRLTWLKVSVAKTRHVLVLGAEVGETADASCELNAQYLEAVADGNEVGIVAHVARRGTQVNDGRRARTTLGKRVHVRHDVVSQQLLLAFRLVEVDVLHVGLHLGELLVADVQAELLLRTRQVEPEAAPVGELLAIAKSGQHLVACVARHQRRLVLVVFARTHSR